MEHSSSGDYFFVIMNVFELNAVLDCSLEKEEKVLDVYIKKIVTSQQKLHQHTFSTHSSHESNSRVNSSSDFFGTFSISKFIILLIGINIKLFFPT